MAIVFKSKKPLLPVTAVPAVASPVKVPPVAPVAASKPPVPTSPPPSPQKAAVAPVVATAKPSAPVPAPKPKVVYTFGGAKGKTPLTKTVTEAPVIIQTQNTDLEDAGMMTDSAPQYEHILIGDRVTITTTMFPWVKHYKPGDGAYVQSISGNKDLLGSDDEGYRLHILVIDQTVDGGDDRIGNRIALFRKEFEKKKSPPASAKAA
jgi:hypothetical protein